MVLKVSAARHGRQRARPGPGVRSSAVAEELETKFDIPCATTHDALLRKRSGPGSGTRSAGRFARLGAPERACRAPHRPQLDLVIVDEAHHLRDRTSQSYSLVDAAQQALPAAVVATPVQNDLTELYNVLTLLKPGIFKTLRISRRLRTPVSASARQSRAPARVMRAAMVAHTRAVVALKLPRRQAATIRGGRLGGRAGGLPGVAAAARRSQPKEQAETAALHHLLAPRDSSPAAAAAAVKRFADRHADEPGWHALAQRGRPPATAARRRHCSTCGGAIRRKEAGLRPLPRDARSLADLLAREGFAFARFEGGLSGPAKDAAIASPRERAVLLCTESGGEGRNIQFCNT